MCLTVPLGWVGENCTCGYSKFGGGDLDRRAYPEAGLFGLQKIHR